MFFAPTHRGRAFVAAPRAFDRGFERFVNEAFSGFHRPVNVQQDDTHWTLRLDLPAGWREHDALRLTITDPQGRELRAWTWPIRTSSAIRERVVRAAPAELPPPAAEIADGVLTVRAAGRAFRFDLANARLLDASVGDAAVPPVSKL